MAFGDNVNNMIVDVKRLELIEVLRKNRQKHIEDYKMLLEAFYVNSFNRARIFLEDVGNRITTSGQFYFSMIKPTSSEESYDDAIEMLEMATNDTIKLDRASFKKYVKDEWDWKASFNSSKTLYGIN
jgi:hypothetical protein